MSEEDILSVSDTKKEDTVNTENTDNTNHANIGGFCNRS